MVRITIFEFVFSYHLIKLRSIANLYYRDMKKMKYSYLLLISGVLFLFIQSCSKSSTDSSSLYTPTSVDVTASATLVDLQQGRTLYINNCGRCHGLYSPDNFSSTQWKSIISSMAPNTGLSASDILLVTKYVTRGN